MELACYQNNYSPHKPDAFWVSINIVDPTSPVKLNDSTEKGGVMCLDSFEGIVNFFSHSGYVFFKLALFITAPLSELWRYFL